MKPTFDYVNSQLRYDPETGLLFWKTKRQRRQINKPIIGVNGKGYIQIGIDSHRFGGQCIAWLLYTGEWPKEEIDHINRNKKDNRIINLREATRSENKRNVSLQSNNTSTIQGVSFHKEKKRWQVKIKIYNKAKHMGWFKTFSEAKIARIEAEKKYYGKFAPIR